MLFFVNWSAVRPSRLAAIFVGPSAAFNKKTGRIIKLITVQEILDQLHVQQMSTTGPSARRPDLRWIRCRPCPVHSVTTGSQLGGNGEGGPLAAGSS